MSNEHHYHSDLSHERIYLNEFGKYLVEQADKDYLASRALYRRGLYVHSANLAHQCLEKYFKAILLFVGKESRRFGHRIDALLKTCEGMGTSLDPDSIKAVSLLNDLHNVTRYAGSGAYYVDLNFLYHLDYFVRDIRPYLQNRSIDPSMKPSLNPKRIMSGHKYKRTGILTNGYLEKVMKSKNINLLKLKEDLVWNNPFWGSQGRFLKFDGGYSRNFPFNLDTEFGLKMAKHIIKFFKFEPEIETYLNNIK